MMDDQTCDLGFAHFLEHGSLPEPLAQWIADRKQLRQKLVHRFKPAGAQFAMKNSCFTEVEQVPLYLLALENIRGRVLSYVGYNIYPIRGKRVLMLEYLCTDDGQTEAQLNRHLVGLLMAWAASDPSFRGVVAYSINQASGRMLSRYYGMAKVEPDVFLDAAATGLPLPAHTADMIRWSYCCRHTAEGDWREIWRSRRRIEVAWNDKMQSLPSFNMHIQLDAPGVRVWLNQLLRQPPRI